MNQISLDKFKNELFQLRAYLQHIQNVNETIGYAPVETDSEVVAKLIEKLRKQEFDNNFRANRKIFEYKAVIISLYGTLERTIENWVKEFLDNLSGIITDYTKLSETIRKNHFTNSIKLMDLIIKKDMPKYEHLRKEDILNTLNNCIKSPQNYKFNTDAFIVLSNGNLKHTKIVEVFSGIDVNINEGIQENESLNNVIGLSKNEISSIDKDILYNKINDLVERRNEVAHGSNNVNDNFLSLTVIEGYIDFLEVYCGAIFDVLKQRLIRFEAEDSGAFFLVNIAKDTVWQHKIVGIFLEDYTIKIDDFILIETPDKEFLKERIVGIGTGSGKDLKKHTKLSVTDKTEVAIIVNAHLSNNAKSHKFYLKNNQK